jgi:hypothetical protein
MIEPLHAGLAIMTEPQPVIACLWRRGRRRRKHYVGRDLRRRQHALALAYRQRRQYRCGCLGRLRIVGLRKAMELSPLADPLDAGEALRLAS